MPPSVKRNRVVIVYDAGTAKKEQFRSALIKIATTKYLNQSKDFVHFVLSNTAKTDNFLHDQLTGYEHITIVGSIEDPLMFEPDLVKLTCVESAKGNWLEALNVALEILHNTQKTDNFKYIYNYQILFLTDMSTPIEIETVKPAQIANSLADLEAYLYIVGPDVTFKKPLLNLRKISHFMENIDWNNRDSIRNFAYIQQLTQLNEKITVADFKIGMQLFYTYLNKIDKQGWKVPLKIADILELPTVSSKYMDKSGPLKLNGENLTNSKEQTGESYAKASHTFTSKANIEVKVKAEDCIRGFYLHKKFLPLPEKNAFKPQTVREFRILYFASRSSIPEVYLQGPYRMITKSTEEQGKKAFDVLVTMLENFKLCAIAKRVYWANNRPMFLVLVPDTSREYPRFVGIQIPYEHEINMKLSWLRDNSDEEKLSVTNSVDQDIEEYLESITLDNNREISIHPRVVTDPKNNAIVNEYANAHFQKELNLDQFDIDIFKWLEGSGKFTKFEIKEDEIQSDSKNPTELEEIMSKEVIQEFLGEKDDDMRGMETDNFSQDFENSFDL